MQVSDFHLTYCTNIHPGESWEATFKNLKEYIPKIKRELSVEASFAIGLRLSDQASKELVKPDQLAAFKSWLNATNCYVFTFNGFPFGGFHRQVVKDEVHFPDWSTEERKAYTLRLFTILAALMPADMDAGISTSPLSYKYWHKSPEALDSLMEQSCAHIMEVVEFLYRLKLDQNVVLHLDIEPEPDGVIEDSNGLIHFYMDRLIPAGVPILTEKFGLSAEAAEAVIKDHVRVCYDVCHFAVGYENHEKVLNSFEKEGIKIGKFQLSAALKANIPKAIEKRKSVEKALLPFVESTYLHQVIGRMEDNTLHAYPDLPDALVDLATTNELEWRVHFHVPLFLATYGDLDSTQEDIISVLKLNGERKLTSHLEVETYTWEVLPEDIHLSLDQSIARELSWVKNNIK